MPSESTYYSEMTTGTANGNVSTYTVAPPLDFTLALLQAASERTFGIATDSELHELGKRLGKILLTPT
jgi:hypothetical protein